jgi:hypothetical protein
MQNENVEVIDVLSVGQAKANEKNLSGAKEEGGVRGGKANYYDIYGTCHTKKKTI